MPVSLHTHSWYSLLEGVSSPEVLVQRAVELGYTALALTDTNNLYGAFAFAEEAIRHDLRPLLGARLRLGQQRCVALLAEPAGYRSLCRILSAIHLGAGATAIGEPPREQPTLVDLLRAHPDGLHVLVDDVGLAEALREALGRRLWLEIVRPRPAGATKEEDLLECGRRLGIQAVASTAAHFATADEYATLRLLTAIRQRTLLDRLPAELPVTAAHGLVAPAGLRRRFRDRPQLVANTDQLAEVLRLDVLPHDLILPEPPTPMSRRGRQPSLDDLTGYLHRLCEQGLRRRDLGADLTARRRLREGLAVIAAARLPGYFLTVRGIARHARRRGHTMALRGSAGNSLVCYLLGITDVNPLRFHLPLERFLHPGRSDLPDIDLDFDWKVRDDVIAHVVQRYGQAHAAQISSHLFFQPRSAFREAGRIHGLSDEQISELLTRLTRSLDDILLPAAPPKEKEKSEGDSSSPLPCPRGRGVGGEGADSGEALPPHPRPLSPEAGERGERKALSLAGERQDRKPYPCPRSFPLEPERWPRILADARRLIGRPHHLSIHPGGVVITPGPIADHVPLERAAKGVIVTQFDKDAIEKAGLVKIDLLGNRGLATVDEAQRLAHVPAPPEPDGDPATLALLRRGDTLGVTQLESPAMRRLLVQLRPRGLDDVIQTLALIRPSAASMGMKEVFIRRRRGLDPVQVVHPRLAGVLDETCGLMVYEDDALRVVQALTGLDAPTADRFRKRITKHTTVEESQVLKAEFVGLCARQGVPAEVVDVMWPQLAKFNRYSFCKSHAVSYGLIAWRSAWLKAHHPIAFWTAALNNNAGMYPRRVFVEAMKRAGVELRLPCVNRAQREFTKEGAAVRIGLGAIAGLPEELQIHLVEDRARRGPYASLIDFRRRVRPGPEALALLIRTGALDWTGRPRPALFLDAEVQDRQGALAGELFADQPLIDWAPADYDERRRLHDQWQLLGFVLGPPLYALFRPPGPPGAGPPLIGSHEAVANAGRLVRMRGLVAAARHTFTEDGRPLQFITLEDEHGLTDVTVFPGTCEQTPHLTLGPYEATGVVEEHHGVFTLMARAFELLNREKERN